MIAVTLGALCMAVAVVAWRLKNRNTFLQKENQLLKAQLQEAIQKLTEFQPSSDARDDGLFQRAVEGLVALGPAWFKISMICLCSFRRMRFRSSL
jgi:hypothetical protein